MTLTTLRFVVIIGMLNLVISARATYDPKTAVPGFLRSLGFVNTTVADIEKYDEEMCTKSGGPNAYENQKKTWHNLTICFMSVVREANDEADNLSQTSINFMKMGIFLKSYCRKVPKFENCFKNLTDSLKTCLDPEKHEHANVIYNTLSSTMKYLCNDGISQLVEFYLSDGQSCIMLKKKDIEGCANRTVLKHFQETIHNGAALGGLGALHLLEPNRDRCTVLDDLQHCTVGALRSCVQSSPAELSNSVFNIVKKETTCDRLLKSQAPPIRVVNFLLITAISAISLRSAYE